MPRADPVPLSQLAAGPPGDCYALLGEKAADRTRQGKPFYTCTFRDKTRSYTAKIWADSPTFADCESDWVAGQVYKLRAVLTDHPQYGWQLELLQSRPVADADRARGYDPADYVVLSRFDPAAGLAEIRGLLAAEIRDAGLRDLTLGLLDAHAGKLVRLPASAKQFHAFPGGWVEHTVCVVKTCRLLTDFYALHYADTMPLNRDVVLAAAALHDIGRVAEYDLPGFGPPDVTLAGALHGHIMLGRDLVRDFALTLPELDSQKLLLLEHVILSHLNTPAWGSPRLPMVPEALILHHADDLDAKLELFARALGGDAGEGPLTARDPLLGKALWKNRPI